MIPHKTIEELITKHSILEKDLSSGSIDKKNLLKNQKNILISTILLAKPSHIVLLSLKKGI